MDLFSTAETIVVFDLETTGMDPNNGERVIEVGAVKVRADQIIDHFESLINPAFMVSREMETINGISNAMLVGAPEASVVMEDFVKFIGNCPLVAHNIGFDLKFLEFELERIGKMRPFNVTCTLQIARRLYPDVINHKLATLARYKNLPVTAQLHRALADADLAARLWLQMNADLRTDYGFAQVDFELMKKIGKMNRDNADKLIRQEVESARTQPVETTGNLFG